MKSYKHYIKESTKRKYLAFVIIALLAAVLLVMLQAQATPSVAPGHSSPMVATVQV